MKYKVLTKQETCAGMEELLHTRLVVSRYNDGEYLLMNKKIGHPSEKVGEISSLLRKSIKKRGQFVCINVLKDRNIRLNDLWVKTQQYLAKEGERDLYGAVNWLVYDFKTECKLLPHFFSGKVLMVTGHKTISEKFSNLQLDFYYTSLKGSSEYYKKYKEDLIKLSSESYDNILFSCGPVGKVLLADLIDECGSNLIDMGALASAISGRTGDWPMSWTRRFKPFPVNVKKLTERFLSKLSKG